MDYIKNRNELVAGLSLRKDALEILNAGYEGINTENILRNFLSFEGSSLRLGEEVYNCSDYENIYFFAVGKCAFQGAKIIESVLGEKIKDGLSLDANSGPLQKIRSFQGTHPLPSEYNIEITRQLVRMLKNVGEKDLVLVLISGGGSALLCLPHKIDCENLMRITSELIKSGADIYEINIVRKHLSEIKGGQLAELAYPAKVVSLIFSDVLGDDISVIASGPTVRDETTVHDAWDVLNKYDILKRCGIEELELKETPKDEKYFKRIKNIIVASNKYALQAMKKKAEEIGYESQIKTDRLAGEAREVGTSFVKEPKKQKRCLIAGGETTVNVMGRGKGGRNQETVLASLPHLPAGRVFISAASDGFDNTDMAGALGDLDIFSAAKKLGLDINEYLADNNAYEFFAKAGGHIETGVTGSNVSDLFLLLDN